MRKADVIAHFGTETAAAKALGCTKSAVNQWKDDRPIPLQRAIRAESVSNGRLKLDLSLYEGTADKTLVDFGRSAARSRRHITA